MTLYTRFISILGDWKHPEADGHMQSTGVLVAFDMLVVLLYATTTGIDRVLEVALEHDALSR